MTIGVALVDTVPLGVDTPHDLARARAMFAASQEGGARTGRINSKTEP